MTALRECAVCTELKDPAAFPDALLTDRCGHASGTCVECVLRCIRAQLEVSSAEIICPECAGILPSEVIRRYADANSRQRYDELCMHRIMEEDTDFIWCVAGCGSGQIHDSGAEQPIVKCASCGSRACFSCRVPWHVGMTCVEWSFMMTSSSAPEDTQLSETLRQRAQELRASQDTISRTTKLCPQCHWNIEKNGGCSHMTCESYFIIFFVRQPVRPQDNTGAVKMLSDPKVVPTFVWPRRLTLKQVPGAGINFAGAALGVGIARIGTPAVAT